MIKKQTKLQDSLISHEDLGLLKERLSDFSYSKIHDLDNLKEMLVPVHYKSGSQILRFGEIESQIRFLTHGIVKIYHNVNDPYIFDFRTRGDFLSDTHSLENKTQSEFNFQAITDCTFLSIHSSQFISNAYINHQEFKSAIIDYYLLQSHKRQSFQHIKSAEERYKYFCKNFHEVVNYVKQSDIADFIGITPQSLSRIRKECW